AGRAPVLPHDRGGDRLQRLTVPEDERLALVGDPDRADVGVVRARGLQRLLRARLHRLPDLGRVVLDPTWSRKVLRDLVVALAAHLAGPRVDPDHDGGGSGRAFVES